MSLGLLWIFFVFLSFMCLISFGKKNVLYVFFGSLIYFKFWSWFRFVFQVKLVFLIRFMIKPKILGQTRVIRVRPCLVFNFFYTRFFWFKGAFGKHTIRPILAIIQRKKWVLSNKALKNKEKIFSKNKSFFAYCQKS